MVPRAMTLTLPLPADRSVSADGLSKLLDQLIALQKANRRGGHFNIIRDGDVFHVVPAEIRDTQGNWSPQKSLLDTRISLSEQERTPTGLYRAIAAAVSSAAHVSMSVVLNNGFVIGPAREKRITFQAADEPARSVLMRAFAESDERKTWALLHTTEDGANVFSLNIIDMPGPRSVDAQPPAVTDPQKSK